MLLIDTIYIHDGGGKVLLDYLINSLEENAVECVYLFDERIKDLPDINSKNQVHFLKPSLWQRFLFYKKNKKTFDKIFCMGNLPPNIHMEAEVITYYHSPLYLKSPEDFSTIENIKYDLKRKVLRAFSKNTNTWLVQTPLIKQRFVDKFNINQKIVQLLPFFPPFEAMDVQVNREANSFVYVSNATSHKNHIRLIDAFCAFYDKYKVGKLTLTVSEIYKEVSVVIENKSSLGYPIVNVGFVDRETLQTLYLSTEYLIFPSLAESFGLGLVEAINNGCKVIGADLPYTYAVCEPSLVFDPLKVASIAEAFENTLKNDVDNSTSLMNDGIDDLVKLLS